ncbi:mast cell protease 1A-like [Clupea harengus]|uniref:trypsin n=1 Tax=Clupea harengus TaxID=7950 RepID=A0A6P8GP54_CLUHA|nr:mast cell protease 1A-like [Clupea harengus]
MLVFLLLSNLSFSGAVQSGIFGGREAKPHSRPYMASLQIPTHSTPPGHHTCGGVLIREDYVLTAAHCLNRSIPNFRDMEVVLGAHNINQKEASQQRIKVKKFLKHPLFTSQYDYDIMLLKLKTKAKLNKFVRVMGLPKKDGIVPPKVRCWVAGWGMRAPGSPAEHLLQEVQVQMKSQKDCEASWTKYFNSTHMTCSSSSEGKGFCQGDSGGPLVCNTKAQGIAAYTNKDCTDPAVPQVYIRISAFLPWMKKVMKGQDSEP